MAERATKATTSTVEPKGPMLRTGAFSDMIDDGREFDVSIIQDNGDDGYF